MTLLPPQTQKKSPSHTLHTLGLTTHLLTGHTLEASTFWPTAVQDVHLLPERAPVDFCELLVARCHPASSPLPTRLSTNHHSHPHTCDVQTYAACLSGLLACSFDPKYFDSSSVYCFCFHTEACFTCIFPPRFSNGRLSKPGKLLDSGSICYLTIVIQARSHLLVPGLTCRKKVLPNRSCEYTFLKYIPFDHSRHITHSISRPTSFLCPNFAADSVQY